MQNHPNRMAFNYSFLNVGKNERKKTNCFQNIHIFTNSEVEICEGNRRTETLAYAIKL